MEYQSLTVDDEVMLLRNRLRKYEADHFEQDMNRQALLATGDDDPSAMAAIQEATAIMAKLDAGHAAILARLRELTRAENGNQ